LKQKSDHEMENAPYPESQRGIDQKPKGKFPKKINIRIKKGWGH